MHPDIERLAKISDTDERHKRAGFEIEAERQGISDAKAAVLVAVELRDGIAAELSENRRAEQVLLRRIEQYEIRLARAIRALETGAGDAAAAERQRIQCEEIIDNSETDLLEVLKAQESIGTRLAAAEAAIKAEEATLIVLEEAAPGHIAALEEERTALATLSKALKTKLTTEILSRYELLRVKKPPAVARVFKNACKSCRIVVHPQVLIDLSRGRAMACRGCGRWLAPME